MRFLPRNAFWRRRAPYIAAAALVLVALFTTPPVDVYGQGTVVPPNDWLEPRGLNVVDLVGQLPEDALRNAILSYETGGGLVQYISGRRNGDEVQITARLTPRYGPDAEYTIVGCLGQLPSYDQMGSVMPAGSVRLFAGAEEVTGRIIQVHHIPAALVRPTYGAEAYARYPWSWVWYTPPAGEPLGLPANMGCAIVLAGRLTDLTAHYTVHAPPAVQVALRHSQTWDAHSLFGAPVGDARGILAALVEQMHARYGERHDKFLIDAPDEADYLWFVYPPTPIDPYAAGNPANLDLPGSGTYRLALGVSRLTVDNLNSMGVPLAGQFRDSDQTPGAAFLEYLTPLNRIASPEYFLPPGIAYDPCMTLGGCSPELLEQVYTTTYPITAHYLQVERLPDAPLTRHPLRQVGKTYGESGDFVAYLPFVAALEGRQMGCPCGWFHEDGRMVDFEPAS